VKFVYIPIVDHRCDVELDDPLDVRMNNSLIVGTIAQCETCKQYWIVEPPIQVSRGQQSVMNRWVKIRKRKAERIMRKGLSE